MHSSRTTHPIKQRQHGAVFIVMLVILILGATVYLVSALSKVTLQTARNEASSNQLAQAKEIIIGYAVNGTGGGQRPGDMPYPDRLVEATPDYDGTTDSCPAPLQPAPTPTGCLGRFPWLTLGMPIDSPTQNDPMGYMPWYAVSANLTDPAGVTLNSELLNSAPHTWLTVRDMNGNILSSRVAFVIIIPGPPINGETRPTLPLAGANQYLESITVPATCTAPCVPGTYSNADADDDFIMGDEHRWIDDPSNPGHQIDDPNYHFNDKLIYVTIDDLMPLIEKRIGREVKACLDNYASLSANKYPWAASALDPTYTSTNTPPTYFGRIPVSPVIITSTAPLSAGNTSNTYIQNLFSALDALNTAVQNCEATGSSQTALAAAGSNLVNAATAVAGQQPTTPAISSTITNYAITAGTRAQSVLVPSRCSRIQSGSSHTVQTNLSNTYSGLGSITVATQEDGAMSPNWPAGCFVSGTYWDDWKNLVFYQVASGFQPNGSLSCTTGVSCLTINGSGNTNGGNGTYHAAVIIAGKKLGAQVRATPFVTPPNDYLSNATNEFSADPSFVTNAHDDAGSSKSFITYKPSDPYYQSVNDLVLCLDGKTNCQ